MKNIRSMFRLYAFNQGIYNNDLVILNDYKLDNRLNRETLNNKIMLDLGERYSYWSHTLLLKNAIDTWFDAHEYNIKRMADTLDYEYNPLILSKDYKEEFEEENTENTENDNNKTRTDNLTELSEDTNNVITNSSSSTNSENKISAYDVNTYQPQDKNDTVNSGNTTTANTDNLRKTNTGTQTDVESLNEERNYQGEHTKRNYGTETNKDYAELIEKEREIALFNIYDWITESLGEDICLGIY